MLGTSPTKEVISCADIGELKWLTSTPKRLRTSKPPLLWSKRLAANSHLPRPPQPFGRATSTRRGFPKAPRLKRRQGGWVPHRTKGQSPQLTLSPQSLPWQTFGGSRGQHQLAQRRLPYHLLPSIVSYVPSELTKTLSWQTKSGAAGWH